MQVRANFQRPQGWFSTGLFCLALIVAGSMCVAGQTAVDTGNGFKAYGSFEGSNLDSVNLQTGNFLLHAPIVPGYPQRGGHFNPQSYVYVTSQNWSSRCANANGTGCYWAFGGTGITFELVPMVTAHRLLLVTTDPQFGASYAVGGYSLSTWDGAPHPVADISGNQTSFETVDGTGYRIDVSNPDSNGIPTTVVITDQHGSQYQGNFGAGRCSPPGFFPAVSPGGHGIIYDNWTTSDKRCDERSVTTQVVDANGNQMGMNLPARSTTPQLDTMGRPIWPLQGNAQQLADSTGCVNTLPFAYSQQFTYLAANGGSNQIKVCSGTITLQTNFGVANTAEIQNSPNGIAQTQFPVITSILLPDGTKWVFNYDSYGDVTSIGLPQGGTLSYTWTTVHPSLTISNPAGRVISARTLTDVNGHASTWSYQWGSRNPDGTLINGKLTNTVTDPAGNDTVHVFASIGGGGLYEVSTRYYQGTQSAATLLKQIDTSYARAAGAAGGTANPVPTDIRTTLYPSGKVGLVHKDYDSLPNRTFTTGNVIAEKVYDWGQGGPGALLRETDTSYVWQNDARYLTANLLALPASVVIKDGNGNRMAETDYIYDESQYLTASNITTQHGAPPNTVRGNLTTVKHWLNTSNSFITSHANWYDTGEVYQQIDPLGNTTTHSYDPAYTGAYSTKTQDALGHFVSGTYDFNTGLLTSFTNANANATTQASGAKPGDAAHTTNYAYDFIGRMTSATLPADPAGNQPQTSFNYPDATTVERLHKITASLTDDAFTYTDGLGCSIRSKHVTPDGNALVDTTYDGLGRAASVTNPYFVTSELTYGVTQSQYDALGRVTQITKQDGSISSVSYSDNCTTTTDEAGMQRRACTDGAGRLVEVDEPGDNFPGSQASGSLAISGSLQSKSGVGAIGATRGTTTVTISGSNQFIPGSPAPPCDPGTICNTTPNPPLYDSGKIYVVVNSHEYDYFYGGGGNSSDSASSAAQGLVNVIQADASRLVNASVPANGATLTLTAVNAGTAGNFAFSTGATYDHADFSGPSFTVSPGSGNLSGGTDSYAGVTVYDAGTVTVTAGSFSASVSYGQNGNSTAQQVAAALAIALSVANSPLTASASGSNIAITYKTIGTAGDLAMTVNSSTSQSQYFSNPSFTSSGGALSGGFNPEGPSLDHAFYVTQYFYDALSNLLCVEQHGDSPSGPHSDGTAGTGCSADPSNDANSTWRVRRFTYDSFSRLLTAHNPESGLITYQYDNAGNLLSKTTPAANQPIGSTQTTTISYCYDALNRITGKAYGAQACPLSSPAVTWSYDQNTNGTDHLTKLTDQAGSATYSYDILGRLSSEQRTIAGVTKTMSYTYNLDGSVATVTYPSGAMITYTQDAAGRILKAVDIANNINYVTGATYGPSNALTGSVYGQSGSFSGIVNSFSFNNRLQTATLWSSSPVRTLMYLVYDFHLGNGDNGNVWGITNNRDISRNQTFTYDPLNRLLTAQNAGTDCSTKLPGGQTEYWGNSYIYDAWGNLNQKQVTECSAENLSVTVKANNQLQGGSSYDIAGNMMRDNNETNYTYDQENRITGAAGFSYTYDVDGNRVEKANGTTVPPTGTLYWYMSLGIVGESDLAGNLQSEYVFFDGERVARKDFSGNTVAYYFSDHLKTASVITDAAGNIKSESDYYPWGGELSFLSNDSNHYKFTGKERDAETGLDYFGARYYSNGLGRFISADWSSTPIPVPYADFNNPQTLNLYRYPSNPETYPDRDGHQSLDSQRRAAVRAAWKQEQARVARGEQGTVKWTAAQKTELLQTGKVSGFEGHHINSVNGNPKLAADPNNIKFVEGRAGNLAEHGGNFRNPTSGDLVNRVFIAVQVLSLAIQAWGDYRFNKQESQTGLHSDAINGIQITNVDNAAQTLAPGTQSQFGLRIFTLGTDHVWRDSAGDTLYYDSKDQKNHIKWNCC